MLPGTVEKRHIDSQTGSRMSLHSVRSFQSDLVAALIRRFGPTHVLGEWTSLTGEEYVYFAADRRSGGTLCHRINPTPPCL